MTIPPNADTGELVTVPAAFCLKCSDMVGLTLDGEVLVGRCGCGREWYLQPARMPAYFLTAQQRHQKKESPYAPA